MSDIARFLKQLCAALPRRSYRVHHTNFDAERGAAVALWAGIESSIDQANHLAWVYTGGSVSKVVPQNFGWKVETFRKLHRDIAPFKELAAEGTSILARLNARIEDRHFLVHGYNVPNERDREGWTLRKHVFRKDGGLDILERRFSRTELASVRSDLLDLAEECARYLHALDLKVDKHPPHQNRR